jgi:DNA invertase Pin-like site-specific DNA recombinase
MEIIRKVIIIYRLGRSLKHLIETVTALKQQGVAFKSLTENIDTSTATGQLVFHIFGALAEFERNLINERTMARLEAARAQGRKCVYRGPAHLVVRVPG